MFPWTWWPRGKMPMCLPWRQRVWCLFWLLLGIQGSTTRSQGNEICFSPHANWQNLHLTYEDGAKKNNLEGICFLDFQRGGERGDSLALKVEHIRSRCCLETGIPGISSNLPCLSHTGFGWYPGVLFRRCPAGSRLFWILGWLLYLEFLL